MKRLCVAGVTILALIVLSPWLGAGAQAAETSQSVCADPAQPCAGTPFAQVRQPAPVPGRAAESAGRPLARTGVNTEHLLLVSVAALGLGCLVLLFVEARENRYTLQSNRSR